MKILILGSSGLLGNTLTKYFFQNNSFQTFGTLRDFSKIYFFREKYHRNFIEFSNILDFVELEKKIRDIKPNVIINCLGLTNKQRIVNFDLVQQYIKINSLFPHKLCEICSRHSVRLIHFSSDCVFSGLKGFYNENDFADPIDIYGKSKLMGELNYKNSITIRKSVIGHEITSKNGLLEWFLNQRNDVEGYKKVFFSGLTVLELGKIIVDYILPRNNLNGLFNIAGQTISKFQLLKIIADVYQKPIEIIPNELINIDRSLDASKFNKLTGYESQPWPELVKAMHDFNFSK
jgi:dTDP-4-dehydrorhamnose reductase